MGFALQICASCNNEAERAADRNVQPKGQFFINFLIPKEMENGNTDILANIALTEEKLNVLSWDDILLFLGDKPGSGDRCPILTF